MIIRSANNPADIEEVRRLFREYADWLQIDLCFQGFADELSHLPGDYTPPGGLILLACEGDITGGCVCLRKLVDAVCEMKRLFVRPELRGRGTGRALTEAVIAEAKQIGYERMRLDTLPPKMNGAIALYRSLGFEEIEPYYKNPVLGAIFMELTLE